MTRMVLRVMTLVLLPVMTLVLLQVMTPIFSRVLTRNWRIITLRVTTIGTSYVLGVTKQISLTIIKVYPPTSPPIQTQTDSFI